MISGHHVRYVLVRLDRVRIETALAYDHVARTESLGHMASRHGAIAAIDGGFFDAGFSGPFKDLDGTTAVDGHIVFKGDVGPTLFFNAQNEPTMEKVPLRIEGSLDGSYEYPDAWGAYWINRYPENDRPTVTIFTPAWGQATELRGFQAQVDDGFVTRVSQKSLGIPRDGYVIYVRGEPELEWRLRVGRRVDYRVVRSDGSSLGSFANMTQAISGGPRLVVDGRIAVHPWLEGFRDPQLFQVVERSAVGITLDRRRLILATATGTLHDIARIMRRLGAYEAMNLDGGASSGLWARGRYLTQPQRLLTNALLVLPERDANSLLGAERVHGGKNRGIGRLPLRRVRKLVRSGTALDDDRLREYLHAAEFQVGRYVDRRYAACLRTGLPACGH